MAGDRSGVSAIEFALVAPAMLLLYFAMFDVISAYSLQVKVTRASSTAGDLATRLPPPVPTNVSPPPPATISPGLAFEAARRLIAPFPADRLVVTVSSVNVDATGARVGTSCRLTGSAAGPGEPAGTTVPLQPELLGVTTSMVRTQVSYEYRPFWTHLRGPFQGPITLTQTHLNAPRGLRPVQFTANCQ